MVSQSDLLSRITNFSDAFVSAYPNESGWLDTLVATIARARLNPHDMLAKLGDTTDFSTRPFSAASMDAESLRATSALAYRVIGQMMTLPPNMCSPIKPVLFYLQRVQSQVEKRLVLQQLDQLEVEFTKYCQSPDTATDLTRILQKEMTPVHGYAEAFHRDCIQRPFNAVVTIAGECFALSQNEANKAKLVSVIEKMANELGDPKWQFAIQAQISQFLFMRFPRPSFVNMHKFEAKLEKPLEIALVAQDGHLCVSVERALGIYQGKKCLKRQVMHFKIEVHLDNGLFVIEIN